MAEEPIQQISRLWQGFRKKTEDLVAQKEADFARGKAAGKTVLDDSGEVVIDAGHLIDDAIIARAEAAGKLHALAAAAVTAQAQDYKEKAREEFAQTPDGIESRSLATMDSYEEARQYIGSLAGVDVTDIRGNVLVPAGKQIEAEDVRIARDADQLAALIYSAQQKA